MMQKTSRQHPQGGDHLNRFWVVLSFEITAFLMGPEEHRPCLKCGQLSFTDKKSKTVCEMMFPGGQ